MNLQALDWLGFAAATLTSISFVPQALLSLRTRDVSGVSLGMYCAFSAGIMLWLVYGLLLRSWPLIFANLVTLALALCILVMKLRYGRHSTQDTA